MPFIGKQPQVGAYSKLDSITTSATATYNLTLDGSAYFPQSANHLIVSLNGVIQAPQDSFTISGSSITFASALTSSDVIDFIMVLGDTLDIGTPSDGTITSAKLTNDLTIDGLTVDKDGATVLTVDRATDDGTIVDLQKDGSTVGSIGVTDSNNLYVGSDVANHSGLEFAGATFGQVLPRTGGSSSDANVLLGSSTRRFRDLFLSGGVYLGGTGSANYLEDYEEGTWTPTINQGGSSLTASNAFYTKVGRIVFISFALTDISSPAASRLQIDGLPFSQGASVNLQGMYVTYDDTGAPADTVILISNSLIYFTRQGTSTAVTGTDFNFSGSQQIRVSGSYLT